MFVRVARVGMVLRLWFVLTHTLAIVVYFYLRSGKYPATYPKAHPSESISACLKTVSVALSALSGG